MKKEKLEYFKKLLLEHKSKILNAGLFNKVDDLHVSSDDLADEGDLATTVVNQQISIMMRAKERMKLQMIHEALERIEDGTYGYCEDCDEPIGEKRLQNQPWTTLCITHAEEREREEEQYRYSA